jgi:hypothetical protein
MEAYVGYEGAKRTLAALPANARVGSSRDTADLGTKVSLSPFISESSRSASGPVTAGVWQLSSPVSNHLLRQHLALRQPPSQRFDKGLVSLLALGLGCDLQRVGQRRGGG